jgi:endoglucanase
MKVLVFDVQGNLKRQYRGYTAGEHQVSLQSLNQGIYIVRVESRDSARMLRVHVK